MWRVGGIGDREKVREVCEAVLAQLGGYPRHAFYRAMFAEAGFPEAEQRVTSDRMIDAIVAYGDEAAVTEKIRRIAATEVDEILCTIVRSGPNPRGSYDRSVELLGRLCKAE